MTRCSVFAEFFSPNFYVLSSAAFVGGVKGGPTVHLSKKKKSFYVCSQN